MIIEWVQRPFLDKGSALHDWPVNFAPCRSVLCPRSRQGYRNMESLECPLSLLFLLWVQCLMGQCFLFLLLLFRLAVWLDMSVFSSFWSSYHRRMVQEQGVGRRLLWSFRRSFLVCLSLALIPFLQILEQPAGGLTAG